LPVELSEQHAGTSQQIRVWLDAFSEDTNPSCWGFPPPVKNAR
jgi:hypothetical protein